ncbi:hypothetical protein B0T16DRAFT_404915 [Cercophora newfieldiana]|uniref:Uncharacterized protein n=1 Tax=Cercophora newfieldiana TaxID=92897 RepID=A0AA39YFV4_9PEZI|nr:hypothetical protein B0T16DRAFT_404915 [Cercophora newfieldiana]
MLSNYLGADPEFSIQKAELPSRLAAVTTETDPYHRLAVEGLCTKHQTTSRSLSQSSLASQFERLAFAQSGMG